jgi:hypothetical protein
MRFLVIFTPSPKASPPTPEFHQRMAKLIEDSTKSGELISTGGLLPITMGGARVKSEAGEITVTDGPFTEAKEVIAGYAIIQADSKQGAIESTRRFLQVAGDGVSEIRQLMDGPPEQGC